MAAMAGNWVLCTPPCANLAAVTGAQCHSNSNFSSSLFSFSSRSSATTLGCFSSGHTRPWSFLPAQTPKRSPGYRNVVRLSRPLRAAQEAAQAEEGTEEVEEESDETPTNGSADAVPSLLEEFKAAIAANDEQSIGKLESQLGAIQDERDALAKQLATVIEESQTARERLLRLNADFDNFRKRSQTEKANLSSSVKGDVIETLLPMVDNFERAKTSIRVETEGEVKIDKSYQGIYKQFVEIMKGLGVVAVETVGKAFDPNLHEAIMREESAEYEEGIIVQEFRRGFSIGNKLVRPAMVKVSAGPGPSKSGGAGKAAVDGEEVVETVELKGDEVQ